jgi:hypothetical protein
VTVKRPVVGAVVLSLLAAGALLAGALSIRNAPVDRAPGDAARTPGPVTSSVPEDATAAHATVRNSPRPVDLRFTEDGRFEAHDYAFDGSLQVYGKGGLRGLEQDGPVLATATVTTRRRGKSGTARITVSSERAVTFSPSNFTWTAPGIATGPTTWKDVTLPAGTHTRVLAFEDVAKGKLEWNLNPNETFDWNTR